MASYIVFESNLNGYDDVSDTDGPNDSRIRVVLGEGEMSPDNDVVDKRVPSSNFALTPIGVTSVPISG